MSSLDGVLSTSICAEATNSMGKLKTLACIVESLWHMLMWEFMVWITYCWEGEHKLERKQGP